MNNARNTVLLGSLGLAVMLVVAYMLVLGPRMGQPGTINEETTQLRAVNDTTQVSINDLEQKKANLDEARTQAVALSDRFPETLEQRELFLAIDEAAQKAGLPERAVTDLTPSIPALDGAAGGVVLPEAATDPTADPAAAPVDPAAAAPAAAAGQVASMSLTLSVSGTEKQLVDFLKNLEELKRSYLVDSVQFGALSEDGAGDFTLTVNGKMFLLPMPLDPDAPPVEAAPAATVPGATVPPVDPAAAPVS